MRAGPARVSGRKRTPTALILAAILAYLASLSLGCQKPERRHPSIRHLSLHNQNAWLDLEFRDREDDRKPRIPNGNRDRFEETIFEQRLSVETDGYVYHPNLLEFSLGAAFGLMQAEFEQLFGDTVDKSRDDGDILEFDVSGTLLKHKDYPTSFYYRRGRTVEPRPFRSSLEAITTAYGITWQYVSEKTPISFRYNYIEADLDPFLRAGEVPGRQENETVQFEIGYNFTEYNRLKLNFDSESIEEQPFDFKYDRKELRFRHDLEFGENHDHHLISELNFLDQEGTFDSELTEWQETLHLKHSDKLRTTYEFELSDRNQGTVSGTESVDERSYRMAASLDHQLYDNLRTNLLAYFQDQDFESGLNIRRHGAAASFKYYRHNPLGIARASYDLRLDYQEVRGGEQDLERIDDQRTFVDPEPIVLTDQNIEVASIRILRQDRTVLYQQGRDYRVRPIGDRLEIERVVTGRIQNGETVLISYQFRIGGSYDLDSVSHVFSFRQEFDSGLTPYYRFRYRDQTLDPSDTDAVTAEDITAHLVGIEYKVGSLRLTAEYEDHDSNISPFIARRYSADYSHLFGNGTMAGIGVRWSDLDFSGIQARDTRLFTVEGRCHHPITPKLSVEGAILYRNEDDSLTGDDEGFEVDLGLEWFIRDVEMRVSYRFAMFEDDFAEQDSSALFVQVRRRF
ncbi:MAG: hypothetical protein ACYTHJ_15495 [Planctomycetota bacterium]